MKTTSLPESLRRATLLSAGLCLLLLSACTTPREPSVFLPSSGPLPDITLNSDAGRGSYLFVSVRMEGGEEEPFIVDTGSPITIFAEALGPKLGKPVGSISVWSPGIGARNEPLFAAPKLYLGNTLLRTGSNVITRSQTLQSIFANRDVRGVLGMDCLRHYCIQLDFEAGRMRFLDPAKLDAAKLGKAYSINFPKSGGSAGAPFIQLTGLAGGTGTNLLIDTGCHIDGFVEEGAIDSHGLGRLFSAFSANRSLPKCTWDGAEYTKLDVRMTGRQNTLGLRFLARHLVTLDFPNRKLYLKQTSSGPLVD